MRTGENGKRMGGRREGEDRISENVVVVMVVEKVLMFS